MKIQHLNGRFIPLFQLRTAPEFHPGIRVKAAKQRERRCSSQPGKNKEFVGMCCHYPQSKGNMENSGNFFPICGVRWLKSEGLGTHRDPGVG